jgi:H+/Cl- antiporter ClcA
VWLPQRRISLPSLSDIIARHERIPRLTMTIDVGLQVLLVCTAASVGREDATRQFAAALGEFGDVAVIADARRPGEICWHARRVPASTRSTACPSAALFAVRILLHTWHPRAVGTALITSSLAMSVASPVTHDAAL